MEGEIEIEVDGSRGGGGDVGDSRGVRLGGHRRRKQRRRAVDVEVGLGQRRLEPRGRRGRAGGQAGMVEDGGVDGDSGRGGGGGRGGGLAGAGSALLLVGILVTAEGLGGEEPARAVGAGECPQRLRLPPDGRGGRLLHCRGLQKVVVPVARLRHWGRM